MPKIVFILTMPGKGSWDGKWSGEGNLYARVRDFLPATAQRVLENTNYHYSWPDGWCAQVEVRKVTAREATKIEKNTKGFYGYEWMIDSIVVNGRILNSKGE